MNGNTGLRLRTDFSKRAGGNRGVYRRGMNMQGLGGDDAVEGNILTTSDPVDLYVRAIQALISSVPEYHTTGTTPPSKTIVSNGIWDFQTHMGLLDFLASVYGVEDMTRFPAWGQDPGFMGYFVAEMFFGGFDLGSTGAFEKMRPFYETLGLPTTSLRDAISSFTAKENAERMRQVLDRVVRYVIGCEGGTAYGSPAVQTEGIIASAVAFAGSVAGILLVG